MDGEISNFVKVWISAVASFTYCYFISFNIPKGKFRLLSVLPIFYFLTVLPSYLTTVLLGGLTWFFLTGLANTKLLLFSFDQGPLSSNPSISLPLFISLACLPIMIKSKEASSSPQTHPKSRTSHLIFAIKVIIVFLLCLVDDHKVNFHPKLGFFIYHCCHMYLGLEMVLAIIAAMAGKILGHELEQQFSEPYLSTSLQDFWGRRWNLAVTSILKPTVYQPVRLISKNVLGRTWSTLAAVFVTFLASGLMHEVFYYHVGHVRPTWEVTWFFILHGVLLVLEIILKKTVNGRWRLHPVVSWAVTLGIVLVTTEWLFYPQLKRCNTEARVHAEVMALVNFVKHMGKSIRKSPS